MTRKEAVEFLRYHPLKFAHMLGFNKLEGIHEGWIEDMAFGDGDGTLMAHRNSYKTTCVSISLALIMLLLPKLRTAFMRKTDADVKEVIRQVRNILINPHTQYLAQCIYDAPMKLNSASATELTTNLVFDAKGTAQLVGIGTGGSITGKHFDRIFTDDIINVLDRTSKAERERTKVIYQELQNIKNRGGRIYNTLTPWHIEDASILMPKPVKYSCYQTGLLTKEQIEELKQSMSPSLFSANYELIHIAAENALFTTAPVYTGNAELLRDGIAHIDAAYGGEDYTALTCGKRVGDKLYLYGRMWQKHIDTVLDAVLADVGRLMCGPIYCEDNGDKGFLAKEIKRHGIRAVPYHEKENKYLKISTFLRKWWGNIVWLEGTDQAYIDQIMNYTEDAEHDDAPDSAACVCRHYDKKAPTEYKSLWMLGGETR